MNVIKPFQFVFLLGLLSFCNTINSDLEKRQSDAINYAVVHANANKDIGWTDEYWNNVATFMDMQEYNNAMDLNRTPEKKYVSDTYSWSWDDKSSLDQFKQMRDDINKS